MALPAGTGTKGMAEGTSSLVLPNDIKLSGERSEPAAALLDADYGLTATPATRSHAAT
jgi:hypothetical protein